MSGCDIYTLCYVFKGTNFQYNHVAQFEEGNISTKTHNNVESDDDDSIMSPLLSEEDMDAMDSDDESDHYLISTEILEDIRDGCQTHPNVNQSESCYKIRDCIRQ